MVTLKLGPQSSEDISGWASQLHNFDKGYKITTCSGSLGTLVHMVKVGTVCMKLNQGISRALRSEVDAGHKAAQMLIQDLISVGAVFPLAEASAWSL